MEESKNRDKKDIGTKRKLGKITYEVVIRFMKMQPKQCRICGQA